MLNMTLEKTALAHLVNLKTRKRRRALRTLMPNETPGLKCDQIISKTDPTIT